MKLNVILMCSGLSLLAASLYRMGVIQVNRKFWTDLLPLILATAILAGFAHRLHGLALVNEGAVLSAKMIAAYTPMLIVMFLAMGEATAIINLYRPVLMTYLAGKEGVFGSLFSAYLMPGSMTSMPIVRDLWDSGANRIPLLTFLLASPLVGWQIMLFSLPILGWKVTAIRFGLATVISVSITVAGWMCMVFRLA
jgi:uncharacterized membrane protein YraQ (UPF0718 family)